MKTRTRKSHPSDDSSFTKRELATSRLLRDVYPDLARVKRRRARRGEPVKQPVNMRLSPKVIAFFKSKGPGWQTRIDRALLAFVEASE